MARLGQLRARLELLRPTLEEGDAGGSSFDYDNPAERIRIYARKFPDRRQREIQDGREIGMSAARFEIHYRKGLNLELRWRLLYEGQTYDVIAIDSDDRRKFMVLYCDLRREHPAS